MTKALRRAGVALAGLILTGAAVGALVLGILANTGTGGTSDRAGDAAACKAAMNTSNTGIVQWNQDKGTRPEACRDLDEQTFQAVAAEWYDEFGKQIDKTLSK